VAAEAFIDWWNTHSDEMFEWKRDAIAEAAWDAGRAAQTKADGIAGKWFHSFKEGYVHWQGQVLSAQPADHFLVQLYEWFMGQPNKQVIVPFSDMIGWTFYDSSEQMVFEWEHRLAPRDDERRRAEKQGERLTHRTTGQAQNAGEQ